MKVASFLRKTLDDDVTDLVVEKLSFENMKKDSQFVSEGQWRHMLEDSNALLWNVKVRRLCLQWRIQDFPNGGALFCRKWGGAHPVFR